MKLNTYSQRFKSSLQRFTEKYYIDEKTNCWIWTAGRLRNAKTKLYDRAAFTVKKTKLAAARWSYQHYKGYIKKGMLICHSCDNPLCVNPDHLFQGTHLDNMRDLYNKKLHKHGESHGMAKLSEKTVLKIYNDSLSNIETSKKYGVPLSTIWNIRNGKTWSHITGHDKKPWNKLKI